MNIKETKITVNILIDGDVYFEKTVTPRDLGYTEGGFARLDNRTKDLLFEEVARELKNKHISIRIDNG